ncbi:hypothetical protein DIPPA_54602, partial [Diplonema papillatum]
MLQLAVLLAVSLLQVADDRAFFRRAPSLADETMFYVSDDAYFIIRDLDKDSSFVCTIEGKQSQSFRIDRKSRWYIMYNPSTNVVTSYSTGEVTALDVINNVTHDFVFERGFWVLNFPPILSKLTLTLIFGTKTYTLTLNPSAAPQSLRCLSVSVCSIVDRNPLHQGAYLVRESKGWKGGDLMQVSAAEPGYFYITNYFGNDDTYMIGPSPMNATTADEVFTAPQGLLFITFDWHNRIGVPTTSVSLRTPKGPLTLDFVDGFFEATVSLKQNDVVAVTHKNKEISTTYAQETIVLQTGMFKVTVNPVVQSFQAIFLAPDTTAPTTNPPETIPPDTNPPVTIAPTNPPYTTPPNTNPPDTIAPTNPPETP